ncbi:nuclear transport factor 2 family protein [Mesorhizobium sp. J428]|uniref:nuclear transport factor 2 family protein n=1 Tax=Mesorhizobium sp. J428 TaxID=2898440 RepID=UPI00215150BA|nr:nuclear transport factor 2 family protein [Mesorhizobium sp. J428]MCR5856252.1 nuclear transport factor 2 family protein [Mesorhizobium sp. J428]
MPDDPTNRLQQFLDREELFDLVRRERFARDQRRFDVMAACFHPDAYIRTSWYDGQGGPAYVEATRAFMARAGNGKHWVFPAYARIAGDRATVESPAMIFSRTTLDSIEIDFHVFCRFYSRAVRDEEGWKLLSFHVLFERDVMKPVNPADSLPVDWAQLETFRPSYKFLTYVQRSRGVNVNPNLLGDDRPEQLAEFHAGEEIWLAGA